MAERKKFHEVTIPLLGTTTRVLGSIDELHNKTIKLDLARRMRGKGLTITFRILKHGKELVAVPNRMELVKSYIRRMMRKRTDYVEDSFTINSADLEVMIKPLLITRKKVSRAIRKNLRNTAKEWIISYVKDRPYNDLCIELKQGTFQKALLPVLKKVYPLSFCDLRIFETKNIAGINVEQVLASQLQEEHTEEAEEPRVHVRVEDEEEHD